MLTTTANPVFFRTYSRQTPNGRESWMDVCDRTIEDMAKLGNLAPDEVKLISRMQRDFKALPSGRWLWVGGTQWIKDPNNYSGAYNCTSTTLSNWMAFGLIMNLAMMGSGTGAVIEPRHTVKLPVIRNRIEVVLGTRVGEVPSDRRQERTTLKARITKTEAEIVITVGDSRQGWVDSYTSLLQMSSSPDLPGECKVTIDLGNIRSSGEPLKGFGGVANPVKLMDMYINIAKILNGAIGRKLTSVECCLLIDHAAIAVVAGNIRRSAGMRQFISTDDEAAIAKKDLWQQDDHGNWRIDPERDVLRMANHTRIFHKKPTLEECIQSVESQYYTGEGAIQWAGEAIARANADILVTPEDKARFIRNYQDDQLDPKFEGFKKHEKEHRLARYGLNPCGEIIGSDFHCNLAEIHLNNIHPLDHQEQAQAFKAAAISAATLLHHKFTEPRYQFSRQVDPIVGVSFTGLFDFFVNAFGVGWLNWWQDGRPDTPEGQDFKLKESAYLGRWKELVHTVVWDYCDRHNLKRPNRCTTVQPSGTKSLLTGASPGWHPPKAQRFIRRITFRKNDPVALACIDYGYNVIPSQSDKDDNGVLLNDPHDPRVSEWLVEIPVAVSWADLPGADNIDISKFSALAQFDFYMQVQKWYTTHNTSATIEVRSHEVETLGKRIYEAIKEDEGYISAAILARFDDLQSFPRMPFEPINKNTYLALIQEVENRRISNDFQALLRRHDFGDATEAGPIGCDSDKCLLP
jgi:ribonucleotide reductase class II